jgi:hypothetical protein
MLYKQPFSQKNTTMLFAAICMVWLFTIGCSPVRRLNDGEYLLHKNKIVGNNSTVSDAILLAYVKQKPNRKILNLWRFHLQVYNLVNVKRAQDRYNAKLEKRALKNNKRKAAGKKPLSDEPVSFSNWLLEIGEAPVVVDTFQINRSAVQLQLYLRNHGHFNALVNDSVVFNSERKRADVFYLINAQKPYTIENIEYIIDDQTIREIFMRNWAQSLVRKGNIFDSDILEKERDRITNLLKNEGYFAFVKNYIKYSADTTIGERKINLQLQIENPAKEVSGFIDSTIESKHIRYKINNIYITSDYNLRPDSAVDADTLYFDNVHYISSNGLKFKPRAIKPSVSIKQGDLYSKEDIEQTYRRIAELNAFKFINLNFQPVGNDSTNLLDLNIRLSPRKRQSFTFETQGTNTAGNFGVAMNLIYQNRNLMKGLELFEMRLTGALEVQRILGNIENEDGAVASFLPFNTILLGPEVSLVLPKIPKVFYFLGPNNRKTRIATYFNYQQRPDYFRSIFTSIYGFSANKNRRINLAFNPAEINFVNVNLSPSFESLLKNSNNLFLKNSFKSQFISAGKFTRTYNSQVVGATKAFNFLQWNFESAGLLLNASRSFFKTPGVENAGTPDEKYIVFGIPYSQYIKFDSDYRYFRYFSNSRSLGFRAITGLGIPYGNSTVMPFEKSFFVGGANSIRAWIARSLGPGGFRDTTGIRIDQIGDIKLEWNLEYRQKLYGVFEGAMFIDAGNVWLRKKDSQRELAEFEFNRFYKEIAIGAGMGLRLNFDYFIIRLDAAHPLREPGYPLNERWSFNRLALKNVNFNFGIGYPF